MFRPIVCLFAFLAGCDDTLFVKDVPDVAPDTYTPDFAGVNALITDSCISCHGEGAGNDVVLPLDLQTDLENGTGIYVKPNDLQGSLFWRTISGDLETGDYGAMPLGSGPMEPYLIAHVKTWIENGAPLTNDTDTDSQ